MKKLYYLTLALLVLLSFGYIIYLKETITKIAYININELYENFEMKKELEVKYQQIINARNKELEVVKQRIATLEKELESESGDVSNNVLQLAKEQKLLHNKSIVNNQLNDQLRSDYQHKALKQLDDYIKKFGQQNNLSLILGANGNGRVLYADDAANITEQVTDYVNKMHNGYE